MTRVLLDEDGMPLTQQQVITGPIISRLPPPPGIMAPARMMWLLIAVVTCISSPVWGGDPALREPTGPFGADGINFAQLLTTTMGSSWGNWVDIGAYEEANNPDGGMPDTNPFALYAEGDDFLVVDAGGNDLH